MRSASPFHRISSQHRTDLKWYLILQVALGVFLKLHVMEGSRARRIAVGAHGVIGKSFPVAGWAQMIFGGIATLGFCFGEHVGQCIAHFAVRDVVGRRVAKGELTIGLCGRWGARSLRMR